MGPAMLGLSYSIVLASLRFVFSSRRTWPLLTAVLVIQYSLPGTALRRTLLTAGLPRRLPRLTDLPCRLLGLLHRLLKLPRGLLGLGWKLPRLTRILPRRPDLPARLLRLLGLPWILPRRCDDAGGVLRLPWLNRPSELSSRLLQLP